jgi:hypothetical protein
MKSKFRLFAGAMLIVLAAVVGWWQWTQPTFPAFTMATVQPQVIVQVERDYGHRTGDLITVDVFVSLPTAAQLDAKAVTVDGDFELALPPAVIEKKISDDVHAYRVRMALQSFKVKPKVELKSSISYVVGETRQNVEVPVQTFYTSNTWDGRERLEEGDDPRVTAWRYAPRFVISLAVSIMLFGMMLAMAIRHRRLNRPVMHVDHAKERFVELLSLVSAGTASREHYFEIDALVRAKFEVGPIPAGQLEGKRFPATVVEFLRISELGIYGDQDLPAPAQERMRQLGSSIVLQWREAAAAESD